MATVVFAERQIATSFSGTDAGEIGSVHCAGTCYTESSTDDMLALDLAFSRAAKVPRSSTTGSTEFAPHCSRVSCGCPTHSPRDQGHLFAPARRSTPPGLVLVGPVSSRTISPTVDRHLQRIFQFEVVSQCEFGLRAARDLQVAFENSERQSRERLLRSPVPGRQARYRTITMADVPPGSVLSDQTIAEIEAERFQLPIDEPWDIEAAMNEALEQARTATSPTADIWFAIQNLLLAAGNLSRLLWGASTAQASSREELRQSLSVTDDSPLRDRRLRNHFEHFDHKLEVWYGKSEHKTYVGRNVGPMNMVQGPDPAERFHHYDPSTGLATFWDQSLSLPQVVSEIERILPAARSQSLKW